MGLKRNRNYKKMAKKSLRATPMKKTVAKAVNRVKVNNLKRIVKSVIANDAEVKKVYNTTLADNLNVMGSGLTYGLTPNKGFITASLIPNPAIAATSQGRIGNKINVKSLNVRYSLYSLPSTEAAYTNPFICLPFLVKVVVYRARYDTSDPDTSYLINDGSTSGTLTDSPDTFFRPYNRDQYIIGYSKVHKLQPPRHIIGNPATVPQNITGQSQDPRIASYIVRSINLKMPKHLLYNDNSSAYPTNASWYMAVAMCNVDGTAVSTTQTRFKINVESYLSFTDE